MSAGTENLFDSKGDTCVGDHLRRIDTNFEPDNKNRKTIKNIKIFLLILFSCGLSLIWLLRSCFLEDVVDPSPKSTLVRYSAAPVPSATPTSAVLEVFQVYQPVLIPPGVSDETASYDGVEATSIIASTNVATSCKVVLMEHTFGYSYGIPFVGMEFRYKILQLPIS